MNFSEDFTEDNIIFYSILYSTVTVVFGMAVLSKFLTNEFRFGFRSVLSLVILFLGEPLCQFLVKGPGGVLAFAAGCLLVYSVLPASHLPVGKKSVLITGCDTGFGKALAKKLDSIGMTVFAGCLFGDGPGAIELKNACSERLHILQLDLTKPKEVDNAIQKIRNTVSEEGLWGLVNNAGVWYFAELEMSSEKVLQKVFNVNIFGTVRITKACIPLIKQSKGRIVNVSSLLGRISSEGFGAYTMSKHALVAYSDTLRLEMKKWDVFVSMIEPSGYNTGDMLEHILTSKKEEVWDSTDEETKQTYGREYLDAIYANINSAASRYPSDLTPVIRAMRSGLLSKRPRERYPVGTGSELILTLFPLLPVWISDKISTSVGLIPKNLKPASL